MQQELIYRRRTEAYTPQRGSGKGKGEGYLPKHLNYTK